MSETCRIQRNEGRHGTDTYTRIDKGKTTETLSGGVLLSVEMAGHYGRFQGHLDRRRPRATERKGKEQLKGKGKDKDILRNLQFTRRYIRGKNVVLLDDVLTTGESFRQLQRKMKQLGALSVTGVFLGKTV